MEKAVKQTLTFTVHIKPNAKNNEFIGWYDKHIKIALKAPPLEGKANRVLISLLAKWFKVPKSQVVILTGETAKIKRIQVTDTDKKLNEVFASS